MTMPAPTSEPRTRWRKWRAAIGFNEVSFQYEPIAAAFDYESPHRQAKNWC
jgi:molecular chaperone DnaK (HSP70)